MNPPPIARALLLGAALLFSAALAAGTEPLRHTGQRLALGNTTVTARVPEGYVLELLNADLRGPRMLTFAPNGDLLAGSRSGNLYRIPPPYTDAGVLVTLSGYPHSVALRGEELLIARTGGLYRAPYRPGQERIDPEAVTLLAPIPGGSGHNSRTVAVGPDGRVYLSLGISSNCSDQYLGGDYPFQERRGGVMVLVEAGGEGRWEPFAGGLRNPVGYDWRPGTGVLYASSNGPDHWGYDLPPEVFSRLDPGSFQGMPWFQFDGRTVRRDECIRSDPPRPAAEVSLPAATFPARNAPMGVAFVGEGALEPDWRGDAVVALHGSWGTRPDGGANGDPASRRPPKLVLVRFDGDKAVRVEDLVTGFQLEDGARWARPVGVAVGPDGALYFTSDGGVNGLFRLRRVSAGR